MDFVLISTALLIDLTSIYLGPGKEDCSFIFSVSTLTITKYNKY